MLDVVNFNSVVRFKVQYFKFHIQNRIFLPVCQNCLPSCNSEGKQFLCLEAHDKEMVGNILESIGIRSANTFRLSYFKIVETKYLTSR